MFKNLLCFLSLTSFLIQARLEVFKLVFMQEESRFMRFIHQNSLSDALRFAIFCLNILLCIFDMKSKLFVIFKTFYLN